MIAALSAAYLHLQFFTSLQREIESLNIIYAAYDFNSSPGKTNLILTLTLQSQFANF